MSLLLPTLQTIINRDRADIQGFLPDFDPTIFGSVIRALGDSNSNRHYDNVLSLAQLEKEAIPNKDTTMESLILWGFWEGLTPFVALFSTGSVLFAGIVGTVIPAATEIKTDDGNAYTIDNNSTISAISITLTSLTRLGTTVTATITGGHNLASNTTVTISGAVETGYNGSYKITVLSSTVFTYEVATEPTTPAASATIKADYNGVLAAVTSVTSGQSQNKSSGAKFTFTSVVPNVNTTGFTDISGITGGQDAELKGSFFSRIQQSRANPVANFNAAAIEKEARKIQGVTRVLVKRIFPAIGDVTIYFVRDNDSNIIPEGSQITEVEAKILLLLPATSDLLNVIVLAPTSVSTDFVFSSIFPDTATMRTAIQNNLSAFFKDDVAFETSITQDKYKAAIINTIDLENGDILTAFTLNPAIPDINVIAGEIGTLGTVTFT